MRKLVPALVAAFLLYPWAAYGQSVQQSGTVTPGHTTCWVTTGVVKDCGTAGPTSLINGSNSVSLDSSGHLDVTGASPALISCGTNPTVTGTDVAGLITLGTGTPSGCTLTFATAYISTPLCTVSWQTNLASMSYVLSTTTIVLTQTATSSSKVNYACKGQTGG